MQGMSNITIMGTVIRDPELRYIPSGKAVCDATVAINKKFSGKETVVFIPVTFWGKTAEIVGDMVRKGTGICVVGELEQDEWEDRETGKKRTKIKISARGFTFLPGNDRSSAPAERNEAPAGGDGDGLGEGGVPF